LSSLLGFNTTFESHSPMWERSRLEVKLFNKLIESKNFNRLVVISQALKDIYLKYGYLNDKRIQVAHDGADEVNDFNIKAKLSGKKNNLKIGYVGHLYQGKGIEVIAKIADKVPIDVDFHIIGGLIKDIDYWKSKITSENVYFYGFVAQKEVGSYINALDVCMLPNQKVVKTYNNSKKEGANIGDFTSPLKMFEYMAHKKPIIASDLEVLKEVLNSDMSILVDSENAGEWIEAIDKLKDENIRNIISENALSEFKKYAWKKRANEVISFKQY
jgi:glycosyltransferase involved in cell wall biosynthesis